MSFTQKILNQQSHFFIKYHPELKRFFGSQEAALIFQKSEYWFQKYPTGFWKFFEPCEKHSQYREGDSWQEELGFSRKVFKRVFSALGIHYKSKSDYLAQSNPFQDKLYASYYDRKTNRTYFLRHHERVQQFLSTFWQNVKNVIRKVSSKISKTGCSRNGPVGHSFVRALDISLQTSTSSYDIKPKYTTTLPIKSKSSFSNPIKQEKIDKNIEIAENMLEIWNEITLNGQALRSDLKIKLPQALKESFQNSLGLWTHFCSKVASSKFLMGEASTSKFKAYLAWLIKPETVQAIENNYYSLGDRQINDHIASHERQQIFNRHDIQGTERWKDICEQLYKRFGYATFQSWFKDIRLFSEESTQPVFLCPTRFMSNRIQTHYQSDLEHIVKQVLPHTINLKIGVVV